VSQWEEIKEGFGLEEVPAAIKREVQCCMCMRPPGNSKLYTDQSLRSNGTISGYNKMVDGLRDRCFCRYHAEQFFKET
jgi:hypothetical protein